MASIYTNNYSIELIATGERAGTWGAATNVNLVRFEALSGGVFIQSLAGTDYSPPNDPFLLQSTDESSPDSSTGVVPETSGGRAKVLVFTGAWGDPSFDADGDKVVQIEDTGVFRFYVVKNESTIHTGGPWTLTFQGGPSDTGGVVIAQDDAKLIYVNDGIANDILDNPVFTDLTAATISVSGTLSVDGVTSTGGILIAETPDITTPANVGAVYAKESSSTTELFWRGESNATPIQLTPTLLTGVFSPVTTDHLITAAFIGQRFFDTNNRGWWTSLSISEGDWVADIAPGTIWVFAGSAVPQGWLLCDGVPPGSGAAGTALEDLFSAIVNTYGGSTATDFGIPDIKGRVVAGKESSESLLTTAISGIDGGDLGAAGGSEKLQSHTHNYVKIRGDTTDAEGSPDIFFEAFTVTTATSEHNQPVGESGNVQPTIILNYMIKK